MKEIFEKQKIDEEYISLPKYMSKKYPLSPEGIEQVAQKYRESLGDVEKYKIQNTADVTALFLAGAPGAGKTEFLNTVFSELKESFVIIDVDRFRCMFEGYIGENASLYQESCVKVVDKILKFCFNNNLNFVLDGTFKSFHKAEQNLNQCKKYGRKVFIALVFQDPRVSFYYTFLRKLNKKRNVPTDIFIDGFYGSIETTFLIKKSYKDVSVFIACKKYKLLNNNKFNFVIDEKTQNIKEFSKKYYLGYRDGVFINRERLSLDIKTFHDTLNADFIKSGGILIRFKIWILKRF